jgi:dolichol-phosphate mannosyltransferase
MISIVIPCLNESESLKELISKIRSVFEADAPDHEVILVDDGSTDDSWQTIQSLAKEFPEHVRGVLFRRNFGKAAALSAGIAQSKGETIVTMDADLQDDPKEIPRMLERLEAGYDVVSGWKKTRHDPWHKTMPSKVFNWLVNRVTGMQLNDHNCGFKAYAREVFDEVDLYGELHRFVPVLANSRGFRVTEIPVEHHARKHGHSKYGVTRIMKGFLDLITVFFLTSYRHRPQHLLGAIGLTCGSLGLVSLAVLSVRWVIERIPSLGFVEPIELHNRAIFYYAILGILLGVQLLSMGILAELFIHLSKKNSLSNGYSISTQTDNTVEAS